MNMQTRPVAASKSHPWPTAPARQTATEVDPIVLQIV